MSEIKLLHHVYTSIEGYKTVFASPGIESRVLGALEAYSDRIYPKVRQKTLRCLFHPSPEHICISRVFHSGADHAGRQRSCVHNILLSKSDLFEARYANPFGFSESLFLTRAPEPGTIPGLKKRLPAVLDIGEPSVENLTIDGSMFATPLQQTIFSAVTSNHDMAVITPDFDCYDFLASAGDMLPPYLRLSTAVISGTMFMSKFTEGSTLYQLNPGYNTSPLTDNGVITFDVTSGQTANLPAPNKYFQFIFSSIEDENLDIVQKLVAVVHRYPIDRIATHDLYHSLIRAFKGSMDCFETDGSANPMSDINPCLENLVAFYQAGYTGIVLDVLHKVFSDLEEKGEIKGTAEILGQLETSLDDYQVQPAQKEAAISRLAGWLSRTYSKA